MKGKTLTASILAFMMLISTVNYPAEAQKQDLSIQVQVPPTIVAGKTLVYRVDISNGSTDAKNVTLDIKTKPAALLTFNPEATMLDCKEIDNKVSCNLGALAAGKSLFDRLIVFDVKDTPSTYIKSKFIVTTDQGKSKAATKVKVIEDGGSEFITIRNGESYTTIVGTPVRVRDFDTTAFAKNIVSVSNNRVNIRSGLIALNFDGSNVCYFDPKFSSIEEDENSFCEEWLIKTNVTLTESAEGYMQSKQMKELTKVFKDFTVTCNEVRVETNDTDTCRNIKLKLIYDVTSDTSESLGDLEITYAFRDGLPVKHIIKVPDTPGSYDLVQRWTRLKANTLVFNDGTSLHLSGVHQLEREDKLYTLQFLQNDELIAGEDLSSAFDYFKSVTINVNTATVEFLYGSLLNGHELDPDTYAAIKSLTSSGSIYSTCTSVTGKSSSLAITAIVWFKNGTKCDYVFMQWNITAINSNAIVDSVELQYTRMNLLNALNCDYKGILLNNWVHDPSVSASTIWQSIDASPSYKSGNDCQSSKGTGIVGTGLNITGSQIKLDIQNQLSSSPRYFGIGLKFSNPLPTDALDHKISYSTEDSSRYSVFPMLAVTWH